jgi:ribosomal protein S27E
MSRKVRDSFDGKNDMKRKPEPPRDHALPLAATCQVCKNCDAYFSRDAKKCPSCGTQVA